jgi:DNA-binding response OmpR family regulator
MGQNSLLNSLNIKQMNKILIVDDEPNIVMALEYALKKRGFEVFIALNGKEAVEICKEQNPCLMVLDIMMPDMDGFEVLEKVNENESHKDIKTLFLSAKNKPEDIEKGKQAGAVDYITKPFSTKKLIEKITHYCKNQNSKNYEL